MKFFSFLFVLLSTSTLLIGQEKTIKVSENLHLTQLNDNTYIHTADNSNGLVYVVGKEAVIISTPPTDKATQELLVWIQDSLKATVTACIVDHWHHDAMKGIDILYQNNIPTYSHSLTQKIAREKGLPSPKKTFEDSLVLSLGDKKIIARYFGASHTADDIVVWLPNEQILFGSCSVKSKGGWVGNIADAHLGEWSNTIKKVKAAYPNAKTVIPGHGKLGDTSLLSYTVEMFTFPKKEIGVPRSLEDKELKTKKDWSYKIVGYDSIVEGEDLFLINGLLYFNNDSVIVSVFSPKISLDPISKVFIANEGYIILIDKKTLSLINDFNFENLTLKLNDEKKGMSLVIKEFVFEKKIFKVLDK